MRHQENRPRRPRVVFTPGSPVLLCVLMLAGLLVWSVADYYGAAGWPAWPYAALFAAASLVLMALHEVSHALAGKVCGLRWDRLTIRALGMNVRLVEEGPAVRTNRAQIVISLAGPLAHASGGLLCLGIAHLLGGGPGGPLTWAGWFAVAESVENALPILRRSDGRRALRAARATLRGRGAQRVH